MSRSTGRATHSAAGTASGLGPLGYAAISVRSSRPGSPAPERVRLAQRRPPSAVPLLVATTDIYPTARARRLLTGSSVGYLVLVAYLLFSGFRAAEESWSLVLAVILTMPWGVLLSWAVGLVSPADLAGPWMARPLMLGAMVNVAVVYLVACRRPRDR